MMIKQPKTKKRKFSKEGTFFYLHFPPSTGKTSANTVPIQQENSRTAVKGLEVCFCPTSFWGGGLEFSAFLKIGVLPKQRAGMVLE